MLAEDSYRAISSKPVPGVAECYALADCQLQLYDASISPAGYSKLTEWIDSLLAHTPQGRQMTEETDSVLFIAPMLARLSSVSGDQKYLDAALEKGLPTMAQAFNSSSNLFQSMPSFPGRRERNGELVFWARSNGLTFACYARLLEYLPAGTPYRSNVEKQFQAMSDAIVDLQDPDDGLWRAGLLDPESYPTPESSGSALLCYGLARGVNMGLLKEERHKQAALRAWKGVTACVYPDGGVGYVQTKGNGPERFAPDSTDELGAGAVLLAGSEVLKLLEGPNAPQ